MVHWRISHRIGFSAYWVGVPAVCTSISTSHGATVWQLWSRSLSKPTHIVTLLEFLCCSPPTAPRSPYLVLLVLLLSLGLSAPSAAPLLQRLLDLRCQAAWDRLLPVQSLDQTQAGIHTGQVVPTWKENTKREIHKELIFFRVRKLIKTQLSLHPTHILIISLSNYQIACA